MVAYRALRECSEVTANLHLFSASGGPRSLSPQGLKYIPEATFLMIILFKYVSSHLI
jgi:fructoselysine-6-P-deglycase FrlB-like protein